jgi:hypothetical protein
MAIKSSISNSQKHHECNKLTNTVAKVSPLTLLLEDEEPLLEPLLDGPLDDGPLELVLLVDGLVELVPVPLVVVVLLTTVSGSVALSPHIEAVIT